VDDWSENSEEIKTVRHGEITRAVPNHHLYDGENSTQDMKQNL